MSRPDAEADTSSGEPGGEPDISDDSFHGTHVASTVAAERDNGLGIAGVDGDAKLMNLRIADPKACQCGEILKGVRKPWECKVFGTACTPETPIGSCMVSSEGACAAYYNFGRLSKVAGRAG